jgi:Lrp/AsnC family leucine-responsive transcriptional regulator
MNPDEAADGIDLEILDLLKRDGRATLTAIGADVGLSAPAIKRRMARLEELGVITGYTVELDHTKLGRPIEAFTELRFAGNSKVEEIASIAAKVPEVEAIHTTAGDPDAIAHLRARDLRDLTRVIDLLRRSGRVTGTKTLMVLATRT